MLTVRRSARHDGREQSDEDDGGEARRWPRGRQAAPDRRSQTEPCMRRLVMVTWTRHPADAAGSTAAGAGHSKRSHSLPARCRAPPPAPARLRQRPPQLEQPAIRSTRPPAAATRERGPREREQEHGPVGARLEAVARAIHRPVRPRQQKRHHRRLVAGKPALR